MASKQVVLTIFAVVAISVLPAITLAKNYMVGDESGWTTGFDYQAWAQGKDFKTGDTLVFNYNEGSHTVHKVDGDGFKDCVKPPKNEALTSGNDVITLSTPGNKWYICGVGKHCEGGQKLKITVTGKALTDGSYNSGNGISKSWIQVFVGALITTGIMVIF